MDNLLLETDTVLCAGPTEDTNTTPTRAPSVIPPVGIFFAPPIPVIGFDSLNENAKKRKASEIGPKVQYKYVIM
jgi:hypothetical protein